MIGVRASALPHTNQTRDDVCCAPLVDAADQSLAAHDPGVSQAMTVEPFA